MPPLMWASGHSAATVKRAAHGYEPMHEAAMAASWRQKIGFGRWAVEQRWPKR
jgi:hypothetical protein